MKKSWLSLLFAAFLLAAPTVSAGDGSAAGVLEELIGQLVALFVGDELGSYYPPSGQALTGDEPEIGNYYPPGGQAVSGTDPELGSYYPPNG